MGMIHSSDRDGFSEINVTPFVDVVLVLLVIFMITAPAMVREVMPIQLPQAETGVAQPAVSEQFPIVITAGGNFLLRGQPISEGEIESTLLAELKAQPNLIAVIASDEKAEHRSLVRALEIVRKAGCKRFAIQVKRESTP